MPKYSIISPVHNSSEYLEQFIKSILCQSYKDFELILVDDGSTDNSLEICNRYAEKDSRIKVLTQDNKGAGPARNNGIKNAYGDYLLFYDSDDWVEHCALESIEKLLLTHDADLLIYGAEEVVIDKNKKTVKGPLLPEELELSTTAECRDKFCDLIFSSIINIPWNKVYKKEIIKEYRVEFANTKRAQDAFFNMEYYKHINSLFSVQDILYFYRCNNQQKIWKKFPKDLYKIDIKYDMYMVDIFKEFSIYDGDKRTRVDELFYNSIFRTIGFCRNPLWKMNLKGKINYIKTIINHPYNQERAKTAWALNKRTQKIKKRILMRNATGMLIDIYLDQLKDKLYNLYYISLRRLIRGHK